MRKFLGLALAGALSVAALPAVAADYPLKAAPPPIWTWTGFYVGVQAGGGWMIDRWKNTTTGIVSENMVGSGGLIGGTLGWNWQAPGSPWVIGIEGDWAWTNIHSNSLSATIFGCPSGCNTNIDWLATVRGRIGHANGPLLFYVTGGVAFAAIHAWHLPLAGGFIADATPTETGWAVGAGLEGVLGGGWSLKAEYLYVAFGQTGQVGTAGFGTSVDVVDYVRAHILRAGVNYRFNTY
ncbi:MAG TPA: outer membrane beta-barrel protein [Xanthobacteraceae bacterium]|nr:outer membrane beta-barrel protein [Xanthobacteraceae bacterium]